MSCDLLPTDVPGPHYQGDVRDLLRQRWDLIIAHPPCTYLANSGAKHLYKGMKKENGRDPRRWKLMREGAEFFKLLWETDAADKVCAENPYMLGYAKEIIGIEDVKPQVVQPWMFGHGETKGTCLWLRDIPPLIPIHATWEDYKQAHALPAEAKPEARVHKEGPSPDRWKKRSTTYQGIADAMAQQWG